MRRLLPFLLPLLWLALPARAVIPPPPQLAAKSYQLIDFHSGSALAGKAATMRLPPASLTKIMTVYVAFHELEQGNLKLDDKVTVSEKAWRAPGSRMFIEVGKQVRVEDLLKGIIVQSGNDASIALAEHIAGDERTFAELMNQHARRLGLTDTHYVNSTGLPDPDHYTTAHDLGVLTRALIREFPQYYKWFKLKQFTYNGITQRNRNLLLWRDPTVDGVKTGHTEEAGYCLVASAKRGDQRLISAVMGTASENARAGASQALLNYGFRFFFTRRLVDAGKPLEEVRVYKSDRKTLPVGVSAPVYVTIPKDKADALESEIVVEPWLTAPVAKGQTVGVLKVKLGDETIAEHSLVALEDAPEGGLASRLIDEGWLLFDQWRTERGHE
ncbi:serine-type D-Ala-D-Ala carboxypeptidase [Methylomarinovum caldicuralii]|uniref:serine-type D-Ala-D-Ala carboxypeptidase n=1 Tax=Methylomarinovum caldicuralii TaxID=438856 RepID=A0AAU9BPV9_9GAMM|nr:D-alanyl-D-alanine carboxypeptidase family protein [Methylomarinovum caldicuralii]BCX80763.1 serine-type D-Ala-D-Ala carboxypeptidase [Methylomarinovum caldicuralii]